MADVRHDHLGPRQAGEAGGDDDGRVLGLTAPPLEDDRTVCPPHLSQSPLRGGGDRLVLAVHEADGAARGRPPEEVELVRSVEAGDAVRRAGEQLDERCSLPPDALDLLEEVWPGMCAEAEVDVRASGHVLALFDQLRGGTDRTAVGVLDDRRHPRESGRRRPVQERLTGWIAGIHQVDVDVDHSRHDEEAVCVHDLTSAAPVGGERSDSSPSR